MGILHVLHNSLPLLCGYSIRSGYIVNNQRSFGWNPSVVTSAQHPNGDAMVELIAGTEYRRTVPSGRGRVPFVREWRLMRDLEARIEAAVRDFSPDIIHAHSPVLVGLPALRVAKRLGIPFVYEIRDLWENASVDRGRFAAGSPMYRLARGLESHVLRNADAVVTICDLLKDELTPRAGHGKVSVVANGVDVDSFRPQAIDPALQNRWGLAGKKVLLYAGTFQPYEGLDLLVKAMPEVVRQVPDAHLVIVGGSAGLAGGAKATSPEEQLLLNATRDSGATAHVTFTGRIPHGEVKDMYALADAMCYPRRWTLTTALTTPLKPLEAMAMAKPVIASDVPPMKELVMDMKTGLLFRAGDHLDLAAKCVTLLSDAVLRQRLGEAAREWVLAERQWTTLVSRYRDVYERVAPAAARLREKVPA